MRSMKPIPSSNAAAPGVADERAVSDLPSDLPLRPQTRRIAHDRASGGAMSEAMRTVIWVTGVAFGVAMPAAFAQGDREGVTAPVSSHAFESVPGRR